MKIQFTDFEAPRRKAVAAIRSSLNAALWDSNASFIAGLGCTRIVVSHRLSAVENADWVILLDSGRVTAQGAPKEVLPRFMRGAECAVRSA